MIGKIKEGEICSVARFIWDTWCRRKILPTLIFKGLGIRSIHEIETVK